MGFLLRVLTARRHKDWFFVGVAIEEGTFNLGDMACVEEHPERIIKIVSTSFVDTAQPVVHRKTTLTIEEPDFPIDELVGMNLIQCRPERGPSYDGHHHAPQKCYPVPNLDKSS